MLGKFHFFYRTSPLTWNYYEVCEKDLHKSGVIPLLTSTHLIFLFNIIFKVGIDVAAHIAAHLGQVFESR